MNKDLILNNLTQTGSPNSKFLRDNDITKVDAYNIVYGEKKCDICCDVARFISFKKGYAQFCGKKCSQKHKWNETSKANGVKKREKYYQENPEKLIERNNAVSETNKKVWASGTELRIKQTNSVDYAIVQEKGRQTKLERYGNMNPWAYGQERYIESLTEKYGVENARYIEGVTGKIQETFMEKYGVKNSIDLPGVREKGLITRKENYLERIKDLDDLELYYKMVWYFTNQNNLETMENYNLRGPVEKDGYHLDHKFSIITGYIENIPPFYIGNINNLEMLPAKENIKKGRNCSLTIDELIEGFIC